MPDTGLRRYQPQRELGRGTMGVVYEARDTLLGGTVALKTAQIAWSPNETERAFEERFLTEARVASRLSHPNIVRVQGYGRDRHTGTLFIAFEYLDGAPLSELVTPAAPIPWPQALRIAERVADGLHHAHLQGVVHRDVKPANVMLLSTGEPKLLDFGIATIAEARSRTA